MWGNAILKFMSLLLAPVLCAAFSAAAAAHEKLKPLAGETLLTAEDADKLFSELPAFKNKGCLKAGIVTEVDDLLGARKEEGELLLDHGGRVLRKFTKPSLKVWLLNGAQIQEYAASRKMLYIKDFKQAPKALKLIQAAFTGDVKSLSELFDIHVFRGTASPPGYRFVLLKKAGSENTLLYKRIEARLLADALFFHEIEYLPESGDRTVERYLNIAPVATPDDTDFKLEVPADVQRKTEVVGAPEK